MRDKNATGDDDDAVSGEVLKSLLAAGLKLKTLLISSLYGIGNWSKEFIGVEVIALKRNLKLQNTAIITQSTISQDEYKLVTKVEKKIENIPGEDQFRFRKGNVIRDAIGILIIISEQSLDVDEELCACFTDWQRAFDRVSWTKLIQILEETCIKWFERRPSSKLYVDQC